MVRIPPRELPKKNRWLDCHTSQHGHHVGQFHPRMVILRIGVVFGLAAPAGIDRDHAALGMAVGEHRCQDVEIGGGARKAR